MGDVVIKPNLALPLPYNAGPSQPRGNSHVRRLDVGKSLDLALRQALFLELEPRVPGKYSGQCPALVHLASQIEGVKFSDGRENHPHQIMPRVRAARNGGSGE